MKRKKITKLSIPRELWGRGALRKSSDGKMCCLGHLGKACGVADQNMIDIGFPDSLPNEELWLYPEAFREDVGGVCDIAAEINDHAKMSKNEKEHRLKILFRSRGIQLTFRGKHAR